MKQSKFWCSTFSSKSAGTGQETFSVCKWLLLRLGIFNLHTNSKGVSWLWLNLEGNSPQCLPGSDVSNHYAFPDIILSDIKINKMQGLNIENVNTDGQIYFSQIRISRFVAVHLIWPNDRSNNFTPRDLYSFRTICFPHFSFDCFVIVSDWGGEILNSKILTHWMRTKFKFQGLMDRLTWSLLFLYDTLSPLPYSL